jgi:hypothetical protein
MVATFISSSSSSSLRRLLILTVSQFRLCTNENKLEKEGSSQVVGDILEQIIVSRLLVWKNFLVRRYVLFDGLKLFFTLSFFKVNEMAVRLLLSVYTNWN